MKINSVTTEALSDSRKVICVSVTKYKTAHKPTVRSEFNPFWDVEETIKQHMEYDDEKTKVYMVTVRTTKGKFIQGYVKGCFK